MSNLIALRDASPGPDGIINRDAQAKVVGYLDQHTGRVYADDGGLHVLHDMVPTDYILGEKGQPVRGVDGRLIHVSQLANMAADHYYREIVKLTGKPTSYHMRNEDGTLVKMDLGVADVHTPATLPNYAAGYHIAEGVADIASPAILVPKQSNVYYTWNSTSDFNRKIPNASAPGAAVAEVNPGLSPATYSTVEYALGGYLPTEVQSNADTPLKPFQKMVQIIVDGLKLEREFRVATVLQTSGSWNANLVTTVAAGSQWDGGAASDPIFNIHHAIEQSFMPITGIVWSELVEHDFLRNPAVQKYFTFKDMIDGLPDPQKLSSTLHLPPIYTAKMKYITGGNLTYVWGNHVVFIRQPAEQPPVSQMDVASNYTFRWIGGSAPDGTPTAGFLVRTYFDPKRGPRGGTQVVVVHNDTEVQTSGLVGGLLLSAHQ